VRGDLSRVNICPRRRAAIFARYGAGSAPAAPASVAG
jgi:hypothetical protein